MDHEDVTSQYRERDTSWLEAATYQGPKWNLKVKCLLVKLELKV
jgi:hypothetical protein